MDPWKGQDSREAGKDDWQTPRRRLDQAYLQLESSGINQAERGKQGRPAKIWGNRGNYDLTSDTTWLTTAKDGSTWDSIEVTS